MGRAGQQYRLEVLGPFRLLAPDGCRIDITSRKGQALVVMLAVAGGGERTRSWLQGQLWGSRLPEQARASLRSELSALRGALNGHGRDLLRSDHSRVWLDLAALTVDAREDGTAGRGDFLEGLDIPGEEAFEDWLREERARVAQRIAESSAQVALPPPPQPAAALPPEGFAALPALAVLPFANQSGDPAQDYLAEGLSEDLIDRLSRLRWLPIIARSSSFVFRGGEADPRHVGQTLGARYVLEGRLRRDGQLTASLADSEGGQVLWSARMPVSGSTAPTALEDLITGLASTLGARIDLEEQVRALRKPQSDLNVRELIWRGRWHLNRFTREDSQAAQRCFAEALAKEPNSPEAIIQSTWARVWDLWAQRGAEHDIKELRQLAQKAIIADCDDARGHMLAGIAEIWLRQPIRAESLLHRAIELNPSLVMAYVQLGSALRLRDEPERAIEALATAIRLSPNDHDMFFIACELAAAHLMAGHLEEALVHADHAITRRAAYWFAYVVKINALVGLGRVDEAREITRELHAAKRGFSPDFIDWQPFVDARHNLLLKEGLNRAAI